MIGQAFRAVSARWQRSQEWSSEFKPARGDARTCGGAVMASYNQCAVDQCSHDAECALGQICGLNVGTCKAGVMVCDATTHKPVCQRGEL